MVEYSKVNVKLSDAQLKTAVKDKTGITLRMSFKMFAENDLPHELLLTTIDAGIQKKIHGSGTTALIISHKKNE